jgi:hypothetical protein
MRCSIVRKIFVININIFGAKEEQHLHRQFLMLSMAAKIWRKCTKLWQLLQYYKPKFLEKFQRNYW